MTPAAASDAHDPQIQFLQTLFQRVPPDPLTYLEIRCTRPEPELRDKTEREFFPLGDFADVPAYARFHNGAGYNVFFSVCPRTSNRGGKKTDVACIPCLWADCDTEASVELSKFFIPPYNVIVESGGWKRRHLYWLLKDPLPPDIQIEELLRGIRHALKADFRTDISSMMRLPGTRNPKYNPPGLCKVTFNNPLHTLVVLSDFDDIPRMAAPVMQPASFDPNTVATELPPRFAELLAKNPRWQANWQCDPNIEFPSGKNSPSEHIYALLMFAGEQNFADDEGSAIYDCFVNREGMKPSHPAKKALTMRALSLGRQRMVDNPGPVTTQPEETVSNRHDSPPPTETTHSNGMTSPADVPTNEQPADDNADEETDERMPEFPLDTMTGIMAELASLYGELLESPAQFLFFDALTFFGLHICNFVRLETHITEEPRLYTIKIGPTYASRKSHSQKEMDDFFRLFRDPHRIRRLYGAGSDVGVAKVLKEGLPTLLLFDEFRSFVNKAAMKNQNLLSMTASLFHSTRYENVTRDKAISIDEGHLAIVGACTVETYQKMFTPEFRDMGVLNRILLIGGKRIHLRPLPMMIPHPTLQRLADRLEGIIDVLERVGKTIIGFEAAAMRRWEEFYFWLAQRADENPNAARLDSYGLRLLQLYAVTSQAHTLTVDLVDRVTRFLEYELILRDFADPIDAETLLARLEMTIMRHLPSHPRGITLRQLKRNISAHRFGHDLTEQALRNLTKAEMIVQTPGPRKRSTVISRADEEVKK